MKHEVMKVFTVYRDALEKGDFAGAFATMSDTVVWHDPGIDLFKIENGKIQEVWTFAEQQSAEDTFWG